MKKVGIAIGVFVLCGAASAWVWADGLAGLDTQLTGTGRIGTYAPSDAARIAPPDAGAPINSRDPVAAAARANAEDEAREEAAAAPPSTTTGGDEVRTTEGSVTACRIEIARRRRVPPAQIAASSVVLRFTIERSGRVRNAEAIAAAGTDLEVAACAKRVLSQWVFAKRATGRTPTLVERTYRFDR
jgi:hypothetical protein